jgi:hypothetical protein
VFRRNKAEEDLLQIIVKRQLTPSELHPSDSFLLEIPRNLETPLSSGGDN